MKCMVFVALVEGWIMLPNQFKRNLKYDHMTSPSSTAMFMTEDSPSKEEEENMGLNELQTLLRQAVKRQEFMEADRISTMLVMRLAGDNPPKTDEELRARKFRMSWRGLGAAPWLEDRLDALNYTFPTTIQINAVEAVNAILDVPEDLLATTTLEERMEMRSRDMGIVVSGNTGSGKSLAYLAPMLSTLSDSFFIRQRLRIGDEERVLGDKTDEFISRVMSVTTPELRSTSEKTRQGGMATGAAQSSLGRSGSDVTKSLVLIVVPTKELGVQIATLLYQLVGGTLRKHPERFKGKASMWKYKGPKGVKIGCVLGDDDAEQGLKLQTDIAITMPEYLGKLLKEGDIVPSNLRVVVYDEADLALEQTDPDNLDTLFNDDLEERLYTRLTFLVGASVTESLGNLAVQSRVLPEGNSYIATADKFSLLSASKTDDPSNLASQESTVASLKDLNVCLDPGLQHERILTGDNTRLLTLTRALRKELRQFDDAMSKGTSDEKNIQRPRVVVFFPTEEEAQAAIEPIRDSMWNEHQVCVLLPQTGFAASRIMEQFTDGKTNLMIATPNSIRGLDFPALTHVYTMYLPFDDPREYIHLAGRVGRVGQMGSVKGVGGRVVTILKKDDVGKMDKLAATLGFNMTDIEIEDEEFADTKLVIEDDSEGDGMDVLVDLDRKNVERMRRYLEDTLTLIDTDEDSDTTSATTATEESPENDDTDEDLDQESEAPTNSFE